VQHHLRAWGQLTRDLALAPAQNEGPDPLAQALGNALVPIGDRPRVACVEVPAASQQAWVGELELAPELVQAVLHRSSGEDKAELRAQRMGRLRHLAVRVLDVLALVQDRRVPALGCQPLRIQAQDGVGGEHHVRVVGKLAPGPVVDGGAQARPEARCLGHPVV
jgi:hypothetical protein